MRFQFLRVSTALLGLTTVFMFSGSALAGPLSGMPSLGGQQTGTAANSSSSWWMGTPTVPFDGPNTNTGGSVVQGGTTLVANPADYIGVIATNAANPSVSSYDNGGLLLGGGVLQIAGIGGCINTYQPPAYDYESGGTEVCGGTLILSTSSLPSGSNSSVTLSASGTLSTLVIPEFESGSFTGILSEPSGTISLTHGGTTTATSSPSSLWGPAAWGKSVPLGPKPLPLGPKPAALKLTSLPSTSLDEGGTTSLPSPSSNWILLDWGSGGTTIDAGTLNETPASPLGGGTSLTVGADPTLLFDSMATPVASKSAISPVSAAPAVAAVPEPSTLVLLVVAAGSAFCLRRRG